MACLGLAWLGLVRFGSVRRYFFVGMTFYSSRCCSCSTCIHSPLCSVAAHGSKTRRPWSQNENKLLSHCFLFEVGFDRSGFFALHAWLASWVCTSHLEGRIHCSDFFFVGANDTSGHHEVLSNMSDVVRSFPCPSGLCYVGAGWVGGGTIPLYQACFRQRKAIPPQEAEDLTR